MAITTERPFPSSSAASGDDWNRPSSGAGTMSDTGSTGSMGTPSSGQSTGSSGGDNMLGRVVQGAHQTLDRLADTAAPHVQRLQEGVGARADQVKEMSDEWAESLRSTVRDNPLAAVATALALGMLLSRLTQR